MNEFESHIRRDLRRPYPFHPRLVKADFAELEKGVSLRLEEEFHQLRQRIRQDRYVAYARDWLYRNGRGRRRPATAPAVGMPGPFTLLAGVALLVAAAVCAAWVLIMVLVGVSV